MKLLFFTVVLLFAGATLLASCSGGGSVTPAVSAAGAGANGASSNLGQVVVSFFVPTGSGTQAGSRNPLTISAQALSIAISVAPSPASAPTPLVINVSSCTAVSGGYSCAGTISAPVGTDTVTMAAYSQSNAAGSILSYVSSAVTIANGSNAPSLTASPVPGSFSISQNNSGVDGCPVIGAGSTTLTFKYTTTNALSSPLPSASPLGGGPYTLQNDGNGSSSFSTSLSGNLSNLSPASLTTANGTITMTYNGTGSNVTTILPSGLNPFTGAFGLLSGLGDGSSVTPISTPGPHYLYVTDSANNKVYVWDACKRPKTGPNASIILPSTPGPVLPDPGNTSRAFVIQQQTNNGSIAWLAVASPVPSASASPTLSVLTSSASLGGTPEGMAYSSGTLYVTLDGNPGSVVPLTLNESGLTMTPGTAVAVGDGPRGIVVNGSSWYVAQCDGTVATTSSGTVTVVFGSSRAPQGYRVTQGDNCTETTPTIAISNDLSLVAVGNSATNTLTFITTSNNAVAGTTSLSGSPVALSFGPLNGEGNCSGSHGVLFVAYPSSTTLDLVNTTTYVKCGTESTGGISAVTALDATSTVMDVIWTAGLYPGGSGIGETSGPAVGAVNRLNGNTMFYRALPSSNATPAGIAAGP